jgi:hypothetical protein
VSLHKNSTATFVADRAVTVAFLVREMRRPSPNVDTVATFVPVNPFCTVALAVASYVVDSSMHYFFLRLFGGCFVWCCVSASVDDAAVL